MEYSDCRRVKKLLDDRELEVRIITPENCTYQYQFAAQEKEQFEKSFQYFKKALDAGEELGVETMAINSGWGYRNEDREEAWKRSREMLSMLAEYAARKKYGYLIWRDGNHNLEQFLESVDRYHYTGYLGQGITEFDYFSDPASADMRNMKAYEPFMR